MPHDASAIGAADRRASIGADDAAPTQRQMPGIGLQLAALGRRNVQAFVRDKGSLGARLGITIVLNLFFSLIFFQVGKLDSDWEANSHFGAIMNVGISGMFGNAQPILLLFPFERPLFVREYAKGTYGGFAYFCSKMVVELPVMFITSLLTLLITYWTEGLHGNWILHVLIQWLLGLAASSTALVAGSIAKSAKQAIELAPVVFVPQILFAGFFIKSEMIPVWLRWCQYLCSLKFAINLFLLNEFSAGCPYTDGVLDMQELLKRADPNLQKFCEAGSTFFKRNDVEYKYWYVYVLVLLCISIVCRSLAMGLLIKRAKGFDLA